MKKKGKVAEVFRLYMRCGLWMPYWHLEWYAKRQGFLMPNMHSFIFDERYVERGEEGFRLRHPDCRHKVCKARSVVDA